MKSLIMVAASRPVNRRSGKTAALFDPSPDVQSRARLSPAREALSTAKKPAAQPPAAALVSDRAAR
jgi:hypothetical protein